MVDIALVSTDYNDLPCVELVSCILIMSCCDILNFQFPLNEAMIEADKYCKLQSGVACNLTL